MAARKKKMTKAACERRGGRFVKFSASPVCFTATKKRKSAKKSGAKRKGGITKANWKKRMAASCRAMTQTKFNNIKPICLAAGVKAPSKKKRKSKR